MLADFLYQPTPRDLQGTPLELVHFTVSVNQNAAAVEAIYEVPLEHVLILTAAWFYATPSAALTATGLALVYQEKTGPDHMLKRTTSNGTNSAFGINPTLNGGAAVQVSDWWTGNILVGPEARILARGAFNGAIANGAVLTVHGLLIPRGNIAV